MKLLCLFKHDFKVVHERMYYPAFRPGGLVEFIKCKRCGAKGTAVNFTGGPAAAELQKVWNAIEDGTLK